MRLGIALGGGAAFGLSQIGVLKVLEREGIMVDMVSGTSIGSLVGALWASGVSAANIEKATEEFDSLFNMFKLFDFSIMPSKGLITGIISVSFRGIFRSQNFQRFADGAKNNYLRH